MPQLTARQALDLQLSEDGVDRAIRQALNQSPHHWLAYHTHDSRRSPEGFPDWIITDGLWLCCWELKSQTGKVTRPQQRWLDLLVRWSLDYDECRMSIAVIRPSNMPQATTFLLTLQNPPQDIT